MPIITNTIKKRFVRDYSLPITVFEDGIFHYFLDTVLVARSYRRFCFICFVNPYLCFFDASTLDGLQPKGFVWVRRDFNHSSFNRFPPMHSVSQWFSSGCFGLWFYSSGFLSSIHSSSLHLSYTKHNIHKHICLCERPDSIGLDR